MAILYSNNIGVFQVAPKATELLNSAVATPTTRTLQPSYTMTGNEAAGDIIYLCKVPNGTTVVPFLSNVYSNGVASVATITVGDAPVRAKDTVVASANRYSTALDVAASGVDAFTGGAAAATPYETLDLRWITATFATLTTPTAGGKLQFNITLNQLT